MMLLMLFNTTLEVKIYIEDMGRWILKYITCCRAQYLVARCDRMVRGACLLLHTRLDPISSYSQTKIAPPTDWLS